MAKTTTTSPDDQAAILEETATVYLAMDTLDHNGTRYNAGQVVEDMTDEQASPLLVAGVLVVGDTEAGVVLI